MQQLIGRNSAMRLWCCTVVVSTCLACTPINSVPVEQRTTISSKGVLVKSGSEQPVANQPVKHRVKRGDTIYSIAFANRLAVDDLMQWNQISDSRKLRIGQELVLAKPSGFNARVPSASAVAKTPTTKSPTKSVSNGPSNNSVAKQALVWPWPVHGKVIQQFSKSHQRQGIVIEAQLGDSVRASAVGQVVYAGAALKGYGKMIIVNHAQGYLSAYAHTHEILVSEGQTVNHNDVIARVGRDSTGRTALHFQTRLNGNPVDPIPLLK